MAPSRYRGDLAIADRLQRDAVATIARRQQAAYLFDQAGRDHSVEAAVDAPVEAIARDREADGKIPVAAAGRPMTLLMIADGDAAEPVNFERAYEARKIVGADTLRGDGIDRGQLPMQFRDAAIRGDSVQFRAVLARGARPGENSAAQDAQIKPAAADDDYRAPARGDFGDRRARHRGELRDVDRRVGIAYVDQMMRHARAIGGGRLWPYPDRSGGRAGANRR